ncbi:MAG TPA: hypothetical protein DCZ72_12450 [Armatimonadetes bacterium]|nr:hypothetical protein [Armatimonadota bacterium]
MAERNGSRSRLVGLPIVGQPGSNAEPSLRQVGQALGELQLLQELNQNIIAHLPSGIAVLDAEAKLMYINAPFGRMWDLDPKSLGRPMSSALAGTPLAIVDWPAEVRRLFESEEALPGQLIETGRFESRRVLRYGLFILPETDFELPRRLVADEFCLGFLSQHECVGDCEKCCAHTASWSGRHALLLVEDITEQRLFEEQLTQSEKLAALGQLSAGVAHEIRNPLSAITNAAFYIAEVLSDEEPDISDLQDYVSLINRNVERAQRIVNGILNFARPSGAERAAADLAELAAETLVILDKTLVGQGIELQTELRVGTMVRCRPETVKQALLNLFVNAAQAMPDGGRLTVATAGEQTDYPSLLVTDTGPGIAPEDLNRVFNPFFTTKPPGEGTGLGLGIARSGLEADGGLLEVESELGVGTTFRVSLPAVGAQGAGA